MQGVGTTTITLRYVTERYFHCEPAASRIARQSLNEAEPFPPPLAALHSDHIQIALESCRQSQRYSECSGELYTAYSGRRRRLHRTVQLVSFAPAKYPQIWTNRSQIRDIGLLLRSPRYYAPDVTTSV